MNLLLTLLACGSTQPFDLSGVWRFEVQVTPTPADACDDRLLHNVTDALEGSAGTTGDTGGDTGVGGWVEDAESSSSPWTALGRFTRDGDALLLMMNGELLPQEEGGDDAAPTFAWERSEQSRDSTTHPSGYSFAAETQQSAVTRVQISLPNSQQQEDAKRTDTHLSLEGSWAEESQSLSSWEEADLWPEELGLGDTGAIPLASYLTRLDELGTIVPVTNRRDVSDCNDDTCVLTVSSACTESWTLTATSTDIDPGDVGWQDLSWPAGY